LQKTTPHGATICWRHLASKGSRANRSTPIAQRPLFFPLSMHKIISASSYTARKVMENIDLFTKTIM